MAELLVHTLDKLVHPGWRLARIVHRNDVPDGSRGGRARIALIVDGIGVILRLDVLRPSQEGALILETLFCPDEVRLSEAPKVPDVLTSEKELAVARQLVEALEEPFEPAAYHDTYREAVLDVVACKQGERGGIVQEPEPAAGPKATHDLLAALRASVEGAGKTRKQPAGRAAPKRASRVTKKSATAISVPTKPAAPKTTRTRKAA